MVRRQGDLMKTDKSRLWVVYQMTINGKPSGINAVCQQSEWELMEGVQPGYHTLVRADIANEGEAERLARSSTVEDTSKSSGLKPARR
jgi:hypothetical protein